MKYKLIAIDMDGTLLASGNKISNRTIETIHKAKLAGVKPILATGRLYPSAKAYADKLGFKNPIISGNGAALHDENGKLIYESYINNDTLRTLIEVLDKSDLYYHLYSTESIYTNINKLDLELLTSYYGNDSGKLDIPALDYSDFESLEKLLKERDENINKIMAIGEDYELKELEKNLSKIDSIEVTSSWYNNLEIMNLGVSKGSTLNYLSKKMGIDSEQIIAIGDNENDLPMLKLAGLAIAMGNAVDFIKDKVDYITDINDKDGVAKAIEKFILE